MVMVFVYKLLDSKTNHAIINGINGTFHVNSIKNCEIYMTVFDFFK